jgi:hypothetical protein
MIGYRDAVDQSAVVTFTPKDRALALIGFGLMTLALLVAASWTLMASGTTTLTCERDATNNGACTRAFAGITSREDKARLDQIKGARVIHLSGKNASNRIAIDVSSGDPFSFEFGTDPSDAEAADRALVDVKKVIDGAAPAKAGPYVSKSTPANYFLILFGAILLFGMLYRVRAEMSRYAFTIDRGVRRITVVQRMLGIAIRTTHVSLDGVTSIEADTKGPRHNTKRASFRLVVVRHAGRIPISPWISDERVRDLSRTISDYLNLPTHSTADALPDRAT